MTAGLVLLSVACNSSAGAPARQAAGAARDANVTAWFASDGGARFRGHAGPGREVFEVVSADMDLDGDPDLLISWHHRGPLELYENSGGSFVLVNPPGADRSGLWESRGVPAQFADSSALSQRLRDENRAGLHVWHDLDREGGWRFYWSDPDGIWDGVRVDISATLAIQAHDGLEESEVVLAENLQTLHAHLEGGAPREFGILAEPIGCHVHVRVQATVGEGTPPLFAGGDLTPCPTGEVDLWKADPHGIAWLNVEGSLHPELFFARGAMAANLQPPHAPKVDRYYVHRGGPEPIYRFAAAGRIPAGYERARRVEWVDVDGDALLDLSISSKASSNTLLSRSEDAAAVFRDRAPEVGLDFENADVQCWGDLDGDGRQDLFYLERNQVHVRRNLGGWRFEHVDAASIGLVLPDGVGDEESFFEHAALRLLDYDNDGRLDLWVLGCDGGRTSRLFRREEDGFLDVTDELGLAGVRGRTFLLLDVDNDSYMDLIGGWGRLRLWKNNAGRSFERFPIPDELLSTAVRASSACDVDGDGRTDVVVVGTERRLLRNVTDNANGYLDVALAGKSCEPIGALVRAHYSDGTIVAQRYGSANNSTFSQTLLPLHFGVPRDLQLERIGVRWPAERQERFYEIERSGVLVTLSP